jgi:hypothetical protein
MLRSSLRYVAYRKTPTNIRQTQHLFINKQVLCLTDIY